MRTVRMTLDEELIEAVDKVVKKTGTTRSAFAREALYVALRYEEIKEKEQKHREGYARKPVQSGEFSSWEDEQVVEHLYSNPTSFKTGFPPRVGARGDVRSRDDSS